MKALTMDETVENQRRDVEYQRRDCTFKST